MSMQDALDTAVEARNDKEKESSVKGYGIAHGGR